jgi:hypothetical protein
VDWRCPESTRASINTTAIFASSEGCPSRTPPIESQLFVLAAVPAPVPMKKSRNSRTHAPRYIGRAPHSSRRTEVRLMA